MTARAAVQALVAGDVADTDPGTLGDLGFERVYAAGSLDTPPEARFIVVRWDPTGRVFGATGASRVLLWFHDKDRDYGVITDGLQRAKQLLGAAEHVPGSDGWTLTCAGWRNDSIDLVDTVFDTVTRWAAFDIASRPTTP